MEEGILVGSSQKNRSVGDASKGPRSELSTLDFGSAGGDVARALAECAGKIEVQEGGDAFAGVAEDAAVLYANGQNDLAAQVLSEFVTGLTPGQGEPLWLMLIDLYKLTGKRAEFDERVIAYARSFEKSPPPWDGADTPVAAGKTAAPAVALGAALTEQVGKQFERVRDAAKKNGAVKIDLSRLRSADEAGCALLRTLISDLDAASVNIRLSGASTIANMLRGQVLAGRRENQQMWLLLLDMLQQTDDIDAFEEVALDYAITFEESPPSWEPNAVSEMASTTAELVTAVQMDDGFVLEGDVLGTNADPVRQLAAFAAERSRVDVDCARLRRIDFVSAGAMFNVLAQLQAQGKLIVLKDVNAMVAALLRVMGIDQVARLQLRT
ncbi:MAG: STAS domain-containing protein [Zoogloeaceae bacterium]|nr:STAS domain-containing protein [Rhodocyclaceae bacterium]MCP5222597.1 STAS domain-containing protein [Zoogloeaceae bacterium]